MFKVFVTAERIVDDWENGETGGPEQIYVSREVGVGTTIEKALDDAWANIIELHSDWRNNLSLMNDEPNCSKLLFCQNETEDGYKLSETETEQWKRGDLKIYAVYYYFTITEERKLSAANFDFESLPLAKF